MNSLLLLTILALLPMVGALVLVFLHGHIAKLVGLGFALSTTVLGVTVFVLAQDSIMAGDVTWIEAIGAHYALDFEPMSGLLVLLTVILVPLVLIAEWKVGDDDTGGWSTRTFFALALTLESLALFVFLASDVLLFYIMFEATLIPMYFLIGGWGGPKRSAAAMKFLLFSLAGGLVMLVSVAGLYAAGAQQGNVSYLLADLASLDLSGTLGRWLFLGFLFAFAVKAPMAGLHTWLPDTAEQARPGASTLLVGLLDKIGTFGMIKIGLVVFPEASAWATPAILIWAVVSMIYGGLMAIGAKDLLRLVSYTSISHFGFMVFGIYALTSQSLSGSIFYMVNHGFSTGALFLVVGYLIARRGSAKVDAFGGVQKVAPVAAGFLLLAGLSSLALPGMGSFVGEFLVMAGSWQKYPIQTAVIALGIVLAAVYILTMYQRVATGPVTKDTAEHITSDLSLREKSAVVPLVALLLLFGFLPGPMLNVANDAAMWVMSAAGATDPAPLIEEGN
ncbi:MAG: NADH-quinone oxidoreductase subunit M [Arachnia sp.]